MASETWMRSVPSVDFSDEDVPKIIGYRYATHADIPRICEMMRTETYDLFGDVEVGRVFEKACVSLVQISEEQEVISNVCLCNFPNVPSVPAHDWLSWITMHYGLEASTGRALGRVEFISLNNSFDDRNRLPGIMERNTLFIHLLVWDERYNETFFKALLGGIFTMTSYCLHVIMVIPPGLETDVGTFERDMTRIIPRSEKNGDRAQNLCLSLRHRHRPKLKIRRVVEEDNDDLIAMIDTESKRLREEYGDFYISELVRHIEEGTRQLIVAESEGLATGVMSLNAVVDVDLLNDNFELAPYKALRKRPTVDPTTSESPSTISVVNKTASELLSSDRDEKRFDRASRPETSPDVTINFPTATEKQSGVSVNFESRLRQSIFSEAITQLPTTTLRTSVYNEEEENRGHAVDENAVQNSRSPSPRRDSNAFALELFSMDKKFDDRHGLDYLEAAFECFPNLDYCVMVLPSTRPFFPFLENFVRVPLRFDKDFPMVLYVAHRATIFGFLKSRQAIAYDREKIETFLEDIPTRHIVLEDFDEAMDSKNSEKECYVFMCDNKLIGIAFLSPEVRIDELRIIYNVEEYASMENTTRDAHARLLHFILVPIFSVYHRFFFRELMRLSGATVLYYRLYDNETTTLNRTRPLITCLDAMIPVKSRTRIHLPWTLSSEKEDRLGSEKFSLFITTPRFSMMPKRVVNAKVVVVGASDCGVAFAECLALEGSSMNMVHFTNLTLVSPHGLPFEQKGTMKHSTMIPFGGRYCHAYRQVVPSRVWINVVHGTVSNINRSSPHLK